MPQQRRPQLARFHGLLDDAFAAGSGQDLQALARSLAQAGYGRANPGHDCAHLRLSAENPFDRLHVTPALTPFVNLRDSSFQLTPEVAHTGWQNMELRLRAVLTRGGEDSEFGEKPASGRLELRLRVFFRPTAWRMKQVRLGSDDEACQVRVKRAPRLDFVRAALGWSIACGVREARTSRPDGRVCGSQNPA